MDAPHRIAATQIRDLADSDRARVLCAVLPELLAQKKRILEPTYEVEYVFTTSAALDALRTRRFDLIVCGIHFDDCQMPKLLQHCLLDPALKAIPFVCVRGYRGILHETAYAHICEFAVLMGTVYVDLQHWIDLRGLDQAHSDLRGVLASLLKKEKNHGGPGC